MYALYRTVNPPVTRVDRFASEKDRQTAVIHSEGRLLAVASDHPKVQEAISATEAAGEQIGHGPWLGWTLPPSNKYECLLESLRELAGMGDDGYLHFAVAAVLEEAGG